MYFRILLILKFCVLFVVANNRFYYMFDIKNCFSTIFKCAFFFNFTLTLNTIYTMRNILNCSYIKLFYGSLLRFVIIDSNLDQEYSRFLYLSEEKIGLIFTIHVPDLLSKHVSA